MVGRIGRHWRHRLLWAGGQPRRPSTHSAPRYPLPGQRPPLLLAFDAGCTKGEPKRVGGRTQSGAVLRPRILRNHQAASAPFRLRTAVVNRGEPAPPLLLRGRLCRRDRLPAAAHLVQLAPPKSWRRSAACQRQANQSTSRRPRQPRGWYTQSRRSGWVAARHQSTGQVHASPSEGAGRDPGRRRHESPSSAAGRRRRAQRCCASSVWPAQ